MNLYKISPKIPSLAGMFTKRLLLLPQPKKRLVISTLKDFGWKTVKKCIKIGIAPVI